MLLALGAALVLWPAGLFNRAGTTIRPFERSSALVVSGPYRLSRNPIYLGMATMLAGVGVLAGSLTPFLVVPAFMGLIEMRFIRKEEAMLQEAFGAEYAAYRARVRRWI
jgi:protein-S-isoprenylcysteine O-methyltransferase Ste14